MKTEGLPILSQTVIKLSGCALTVFSAVVWGQKKIREQRRQNDELGAMCRFVGFVGDGIEHFGKPLSDIFSDYSDCILEKNGFLPILRKDGLEAALHRSDCLSGKRERDVLLRLSKELGGISRAEQTEMCAAVKKELSVCLAERENRTPDREKLYRTCPILLALAVILMFI